MRVPDQRTLLSGLMQDHELIGLQVPWGSDMKRVDSDRDFTGFDPDGLSRRHALAEV